MSDTEIEFASLLCSRLCHDLLSPVGALNNGLSRDDIKEVLMQSAIYCGIPAANASFHLAEEVWDELGVESLQD